MVPSTETAGTVSPYLELKWIKLCT